MTEPQPQEYIITDKMIKAWRNGCAKGIQIGFDDSRCLDCEFCGKGARYHCCDFDDVDVEKMFRSRPHTPATPAERLCDDCNIIELGEKVMHLEQELKDARKEAPETKQAYRNGFDEGFGIGKSQCETHHQEMKEQACKDERERVLKALQKHIDNPDSREGCEFGMMSVASLVNWMSAMGYDRD